ncbi:MAG: peptide/nickel transport system permease protein [Pseudomonadota bacterium]|nr:peptide/nickel transport system permease protein [Pseudomonadota bacterium]
MILKRILLIFPILFVVHLLTFWLFFVVNHPDDIARNQLGNRMVTPQDLHIWKVKHHYNLPLFWNHQKQNAEKVTQTIFFQETQGLFSFHFGLSINGKNINHEIKNRVLPSLAIALPSFVLGVLLNLVVACIFVFFRNTHLNYIGLLLSISFLSISSLFYIIFSQYFMAYLWKWFPISGYEHGVAAIGFLILPIITHLLSGFGSGTRWYRSILLEEIEQMYVLTARAAGIGEFKILWSYALRNALLPIVTGAVILIPSLFMGSILYESFFSIPGLGNYLLDALQEQDFPVVRTMVFLGSLSYMLGLILTDLVYEWVDPRVRVG